jgi:hypothetical protein
MEKKRRAVLVGDRARPDADATAVLGRELVKGLNV